MADGVCGPRILRLTSWISISHSAAFRDGIADQRQCRAGMAMERSSPCSMGDGSQAIEEINKAMRFPPYDPLMYAYSGVAGMAYLADGQYERAIECALRSLRENRTYTHAYRLLVMALVLAGREEEARASARRLLALEPGLTVAGFRRRYPGSASPQAELSWCPCSSRALSLDLNGGARCAHASASALTGAHRPPVWPPTGRTSRADIVAWTQNQQGRASSARPTTGTLPDNW
jgi:tetratricopeptide (TPR) repeat protein